MVRLVRFRELIISLYGAWLFARMDPSAMGLFANTEDSFWKSFSAALVAAPMYVPLVVLSNPVAPDAPVDLRFMSIEVINYVTSWLLFPVVMIKVVDMIDRSEFYWRFIAAWNWGIVFQILLLCCVALATSGGGVGASIGAILGMPATIFLLLYQGFIAWVMLDIRIRHAIFIVVLDLALGVGLRVFSGWLHHG